MKNLLVELLQIVSVVFVAFCGSFVRKVWFRIKISEIVSALMGRCKTILGCYRVLGIINVKMGSSVTFTVSCKQFYQI